MPFDLQPTLVGKDLAVRPLDRSDHDALLRVAQDQLIWEQHPAKDRHRPEVFDRFFAESIACGGALTVESSAGDIIGSSRFHGYDEQGGEVEIGWTFLARSQWGGHANKQLKALMLEHAFRFVPRVVFLVHPDNVRSQRALEKIGATRAGTRPDATGCVSILFEAIRPRAIE